MHKLLVIERLSLMLREMDTSVLEVINFMQYQRHCFMYYYVLRLKKMRPSWCCVLC